MVFSTQHRRRYDRDKSRGANRELAAREAPLSHRGRRSVRVIVAGVMLATYFVAVPALVPLVHAQRQTPYTPRREIIERRGVVGVGREEEARRPAAKPPAAKRPAPQRPSYTGTIVRGRGAQAATLGAKGAFEPIKTRPIPFAKVPDEGKRILKLEAKEMNVLDFLQQLHLSTGWTIMVTPEVKGSVTAWLGNISVSDALKVLELNGLYYEKEGNILYVSTKDEYLAREYGALVKEEFTVKHASLQDIQSVLSSLQSPEGMIIADPRTGKLVVLDTKDNIKYMREVLDSLDVELEPTAFYLKHAQAEDLLDDIEPMLSERGIVQSDPRTNQLLVTDTAEHIDKIAAVIAKLDVETAKETFVVQHAEPDDIKSLLETFLPETSVITADERTRQVTVTTVADRIDQVRELVAQWDKKMPQVAIQAYILTANTERVRELGINWAYFDNVGDKPVVLQRGMVDLDPTSALSLTERVLIGELPGAGEVISGSHLSAAIDFLAKDNDTDILANPRVLVNDGEVATFKNITKEPYQESGYRGGYYGGVGETGYVVPGRIQFIDVGTTLDVTPRINDEGWIEMEIAAEDSTAVQREIQSGTGFVTTVPVKTENSIVTTVLLRSGETIVIGGLRVDSATKNVDKIPFFGDIPVLGHLFKSTRRDAEDRELLIFIRPEVVVEPSPAETRLLTEFRQGIREQVVDADRRPFDLGGTHTPYIRRDTTEGKERVLPFVPKYRENEAAEEADQRTTTGQ